MKDILDRTNFVFLDLEETCIDDWCRMAPLDENIGKIEKFLNGRDIVIPGFKKNQEPITSPATPIINLRLGLMSWAVWNEHDKDRFMHHIKPWLETALKREFDPDLILTMEGWASLVFQAVGKRVSRDDMFDLFGKPEILFTLMRKHPMFNDSTIFLIDDAYEHQMTVRSFDSLCTLEFQNINQM